MKEAFQENCRTGQFIGSGLWLIGFGIIAHDILIIARMFDIANRRLIKNRNWEFPEE